MRTVLLLVLVAASGADFLSAQGRGPGGAAAGSFRVATWNVRSGMGIHRSRDPWDSQTLNCTDRSKPVNAWGAGLPQRELAALVADKTLVALAVQEAWNCGKPQNLNAVLGFAQVTRERGGVALAARYGFAGEPMTVQIDKASDRWIVGGRVCLDASCTTSMAMFSTHWGGKGDDDYAAQAAAVVDFLRAQPEPRLFMGDLNVFQIDQWNPRVPCTAEDSPGRRKALAIVADAGYTDAWRATQSGEGFTGMNSRNGCGSPSGSLYKRIDYIFVRGAAVRATSRFARVPPGGDAPSDHVGLMAELQLSRGHTD